MRPHDAPDGRIARQALWLGAVSATQMLGSLVQVVITVRILGPEGYGALAVIVATASLIHGLLSTPGGNTVITYVSRSVAEGRPGEAANTIRFALATSFESVTSRLCRHCGTRVGHHRAAGNRTTTRRRLAAVWNRRRFARHAVRNTRRIAASRARRGWRSSQLLQPRLSMSGCCWQCGLKAGDCSASYRPASRPPR